MDVGNYKGRSTFDELNARASQVVDDVLAPFTETKRRQLIEAMRTIETVLGGGGSGNRAGPAVELAPPFVLRPPCPGDMGWVVHRQAVLYAREFGWDERYEALIAHIVANFIERFDPKRERVAQLRMLYVEPSARRLGIGRWLVRECTEFARQAGYKSIVLWTNSVLVSARRIYEAEGYKPVKEEPHHSFGHDLVGQYWEMEL